MKKTFVLNDGNAIKCFEKIEHYVKCRTSDIDKTIETHKENLQILKDSVNSWIDTHKNDGKSYLPRLKFEPDLTTKICSYEFVGWKKFLPVKVKYVVKGSTGKGSLFDLDDVFDNKPARSVIKMRVKFDISAEDISSFKSEFNYKLTIKFEGSLKSKEFNRILAELGLYSFLIQKEK